MIRYAIRNWDVLYETAETRKLKRMIWVPVPNKFDGRGYRRLTRQPDWERLYGAWYLILGVASRCPVRGVLEDGDGVLTAEDIADKTGSDWRLIAETLRVLSASELKIGWIIAQNIGENPLEPQENPLRSQVRIEGNKIEGKGKEQQKEAPPFSETESVSSSVNMDAALLVSKYVEQCQYDGEERKLHERFGRLLKWHKAEAIQAAIEECVPGDPPWTPGDVLSGKKKARAGPKKGIDECKRCGKAGVSLIEGKCTACYYGLPVKQEA